MSAPQHSQQLQHLEQLRGWIIQSVSGVFQQALAIDEPAGTSTGWQALCGHMGVPLMDASARQQARAAQNPHRGAPVMEVAQVMTAVVRQARKSLALVDAHQGGAVESTHEKLRMLLDRTERESVDAYKRAVLPKRRGMFDHVLDHKQDAPAFAGGAHILCCKTCGAPLLQEREFTCPFCGNHVSQS
jgi:hypothetical protein